MSKQKTKAVKKRAQRNRVIQVVVTEQLLERLKLRAASERRTLSQMAAIILQEGVDK
jgi:CopG-like RHH_1 or ribbon-helix-helix domain, RHH_5